MLAVSSGNDYGAADINDHVAIHEFSGGNFVQLGNDLAGRAIEVALMIEPEVPAVCFAITSATCTADLQLKLADALLAATNSVHRSLRERTFSGGVEEPEERLSYHDWPDAASGRELV